MINDEVEDKILKAPIRTWKDSARRAFVLALHKEFGQAVLESMRAYARKPKNLGILGIWLYSWAGIYRLTWSEDISKKIVSNSFALHILLANIIRKKKPDDETKWLKEWSWIPEELEKGKVVLEMYSSETAEEAIPLTAFYYFDAVEDLDNKVQSIGKFDEMVLAKVKAHLHAEATKLPSLPRF